MSKASITRRDFLNGVAVGVGGLGLSPLPALATAPTSQADSAYYPPRLTGLRGTHAGAFEVAHSVAWQGKQWPIPARQTDDTYDLIVVGGGISGLTAAMLFQQQAGRDSRILILDNHDDFGGHAKRNEFTVGDQTLIGYGGSQSLEGPHSYSKVSQQVLKDLGIELQKFYDYFDQDFNQQWKLKRGLYFSKEHFGVDRLTDNPFSWYQQSLESLTDTVRQFPIAKDVQTALLNFLRDTSPLTPDHWSQAQRIENLRSTNFSDFLQTHAQLPPAAIDVFRDNMKGIWGVGWDSLSTLEAIRLGMPGADRLGVSAEEAHSHYSEEPYIFHFPDGNAGVARALVRYLNPGAVPGESIEDLVTSQVNYALLDSDSAPVRLRLNSTAVHVQHSPDQLSVDVTYVRDQQSIKVKGKHVVMACYNNLIPFICPEVPEAQRSAIDYAEKVPLVYANVAVTNWQAFAKSGYNGFHTPRSTMFHNIEMDFPVSMGDYAFTPSPEAPTILHASMIPSFPNQGLTSREQHKLGRQRLYQMAFEEFEDDLFKQLDGALGSWGFDVQRDITAITVNRWPHGYAYEYNELYDEPDWGPEKGPHIAGRARIGRISIANSDASAYAYVNGAMDAAARAVSEQLSG
ncbi:NAD(P)/FAD-dependent oxidoreductase [Aestuariicella hydrocarbonica]|uniref:NAD(P)/FAD-dependent oxidoreductase n=1 Tax=Pseudomaricurvus hydrocarbonicus TaxID=1470433 RepID=A0A9E5MPD4_9GAMM|nr:FAD/NAD(P)-binding protein [Aestuariicella hydrocarbonica]NHO67897.1 NAD(P)/FAD-dependent oxidoreductase [Aestuariicella hydrocarbonica]